MTEILPKKNMNAYLAQEENFLDWNVVVKKFETTLKLFFVIFKIGQISVG